MNVKKGLLMYWRYKYTIIVLSFSVAFIVFRHNNDIVALGIMYLILIIESLLALNLNKVDFLKKCDIEKTYIDFLEIFERLQKIYIPRFIYGDILYNFMKFYKKGYKELCKYEEYFIDNFNYMHSLIISEDRNAWIAKKALFDRKWFGKKCSLLKEAYKEKQCGNTLYFFLKEDILDERKLEKGVINEKNKIKKILYIIILIFLSIMYLVCDEDNIREVIGFIMPAIPLLIFKKRVSIYV